MHLSEPFSPAIRIVESRDADEHASKLTNWEQRYDQTTTGEFHGLLEELQLPAMQVFRESTSQGMHQSCRVWPDAMWFGLPYSTRSTRINGRVASTSSVLVRPGGHEFELVTPADYTIYGVVIQTSALQSAATKHGYALDWEQLAQAELLQADLSAHRHCLQTLNALLQGTEQPLTESELQHSVLEALLPVLDHSQVDAPYSNSLERRQRVVSKARDYLLSHRDRTVTVPELCHALYVSRRTLQYCFEDVLGINPVQYLRILRLNGARRQLRGAGSRHVRDVAADWGFWHFSQFSRDYRNLFGHSPSDALRGTPH